MCGIAVTINWGDSETVERMTDLQAHRGPDDDGVWFSELPDGGSVGLGSRRLAILDLSAAGAMPMSTPDGELTIVHNGEIYNHLELREHLVAKGYSFRSRSDTETLLYLFRELGPDCVHELNGMFAFCIWERRTERLFIARDHFGIKPLYYVESHGRFGCASEIKALLELPDVARNIDLFALKQYLTFLWVPEPRTIFAGIHAFPAGHCGIVENGELRISEYWDLEFPAEGSDHQPSEEEVAAELRERFVEVVERQMLSDAPLGAFLSAGLDSSGIVAAAREVGREPLRTFTIAFPEKYRVGEITLDDTEVARRTARRLGCSHTEILVEPAVAELLPKLVWHMDQPTADPAIIAAYLVGREAGESVSVLLSGVGGDEIFAGYRKYQAHRLAELYKWIPRLGRSYLLEPLAQRLPSFRGSPAKGHVRLLKKMIRAGSLPPRESFLTHSVYLSLAQLEDLCAPDWYGQVREEDPLQDHLAWFDRIDGADFLNQMMYVDSKTFMPSLNLQYNDKMAMASSVEVRVPFLDREFVEWVASNVAPTLKLKGGVTKHIFREAMRPLLPREVLRQKKAGFFAPVDYWLAHDLRGMVDDLLSEETVRRRGFFRPQAVRRLVDEHRAGREDWSMQIWQLLTLELWVQEFMDG